MTFEGLRLKILKIKRKLLANYRKKYLKNYDFTIISNNCWGGMIYESYNIQKKTPTVGLFFMPRDYIIFLKNLKEYTQCKLEFINPSESKWKDYLKTDSRFGNYPIGKINDVEIFFLHYKTEEEAREKWKRRCKRINWENLIIKFNDQNYCTEEEVQQFINLPYKEKIFFTCKTWEGKENKSIIKIKQFSKKNFILASYEPFGKNKYLNITKIINELNL